MAERIPQSTTIRAAFVAYLSTDHLSPATGKTIPITISKNGAAFGNPSGGATNATEIANGCYYVDLSTTDTGTVGPLFVYGSLAGVDTILFLYDVISTTAVSAGVNVVNWNGTAVSSPATAGIPDVNLINWRNVQPLALNSNEVQVAADWSNILNATSTIALTNTTIKNVTGTPPDSAGVTTLLLRIASALSISAGAVTVGTVASGAIAAASFAANALDAVWSTPARTLTAFSFTVNASLTQILGTALTESVAGYLAAGFKKFFNLATPTSTMNEITLVDTTTDLTHNTPTIGNVTLAAAQPNYAPLKASDYTAPLSSLQTAQAVLNAVQASYNTPGTIGYLIGQIAGGGGDQWLTNLIAGGYSYPEAGAILLEILSKVLPIGNGVQFTNAPVDEDGATRIVLGNSYMATDGIPLDYTLGAPSALDPAGIPQWHYWGARGAAAINGTVTDAALKKVRFELTPAQSAALTETVFAISATLTSGDVYRTPDLPLILVGSVPNRVTP